MSRLRIATVVDEPMPSQDTLTVQVAQTLSALVRAGADVDLFLPVAPSLRPADVEAVRRALVERYHAECGFAIHLLPSQVPGGRPLVKTLHAALATAPTLSRRFDLLYSRIVLPILPALLLGRPVLFETYRPLTRQFPRSRWPLRAAASRPAFIGLATHSEYTRRTFVEDGLPAAKVRTIYNGFDDRLFAEPLTPEAARAATGWSERFTVVYGGRIAPLKRIDLLLDAAAAAPWMELVLIGADDTPEAAPLVSRGRALPNVRFTGYRAGIDLARALRAADVLVIPPSRDPLERFGNTVLPIKVFQYLAAGRAIVTGDTPDTAEILHQDENAVRVPADDVPALVRALRALADDPERRARLGAAARRDAASLTWDARAGKLLAWMREGLSGARAH